MRSERTAGDIGYRGAVMDLRISYGPAGGKDGQMAKVMIAHASIAENGTVNGEPGDQTGGEVCTRELYNRGWYCVLRPVDSDLALRIANRALEIVHNYHIGYSQDDRYSLWERYQEAGSFAAITTDCNCDCSSMVSAILKSLGLPVSRYMTTVSERSELIGTGRFEYISYSAGTKLLKGDILIASGHTAIVTAVLPNQEPAEDPMVDFADNYDGEYAGVWVTTLMCNLRYGPYLQAGIEQVLQAGTRVRNYGYYSTDHRGVDWLLVQLQDGSGTTGYLSTCVVSPEPLGE